MDLLIETFPVGPIQCNCTVIGDGATKEAIVVDPGGDAGRIADAVESNGLTVTALVHTHAHLDHIGATAPLAKRWECAAFLHDADLFLYDSYHEQCAMFGLPVEPGPLPKTSDLADGTLHRAGTTELATIHTPGHTPGSVCFLLAAAGMLFSGDTLFARGIGRTDLPGGDTATILKSIADRLYTLDPDLKVVPGHGPATTIGDEKKSNPFVRG